MFTPMARKDADATRRKLLEAATAEFAEHGLAGARVDRIAEAAGASKVMIYTYFGNKEALFDAVFAAVVADVIESVPIDVDDLPGYAGRLFDLYQANPHILRLATWHTLERGPTAATPASAAANKDKVAAIRRAQRAGTVTARVDPAELLALVLGLAASGRVEQAIDADDARAVARRRATITSAVELLVHPG